MEILSVHICLKINLKLFALFNLPKKNESVSTKYFNTKFVNIYESSNLPEIFKEFGEIVNGFFEQ